MDISELIDSDYEQRRLQIRVWPSAPLISRHYQTSLVSLVKNIANMRSVKLLGCNSALQ
jgi:hypothetical protein